MTWSRRRLLTAGGLLAGLSAAGVPMGRARAQEAPVSPAVAADGAPAQRRIALTNLHTDERLEIEYFREGMYIPAALSAIEVLLRDFRTGERHAIDPTLMDYLLQVAHAAGVDPKFSVISGYRSPQTNARLREQSAGVAQHSLHMDGRAIDVRVAGLDCASLATHALDLTLGGVGYYRASDFVHLDTGAFRTWRG
ncbi:MAG TPA: DUF882 domain-containing protein [Steroidobacteraceae bacterium]|nr:DUF882 domain-containing protein [Steroidobacteraceae bacterium]